MIAKMVALKNMVGANGRQNGLSQKTDAKQMVAKMVALRNMIKASGRQNDTVNKKVRTHKPPTGLSESK